MNRRRLLFVAPIVALLVPAAGLVPIPASSRHWALTNWLLDSVKRRSVATYSLTVTTPLLDDRAMQIRGAAHYEQSCRTCHGSPLAPPPPIPAGMTPHPPDLRTLVARWQPRELFYIVAHGIKFTGMPAWPAPQRQDEVWDTVAFLRRLPGLNAEEYARMARGAGADEPLPGGTLPRGMDAVLHRCALCHGIDGQGRGGVFPRLAGQRVEYLRLALEAYRQRTRHSGVMTPLASELDPAMIPPIAAYYASLDPGGPAAPTTSTRGAAIVERGIPEEDVPACRECHGDSAPKNLAFPRLAAQPAPYLVGQLELLAAGHRGGSSFESVMRPIAQRLSPQQRRDVAEYFAARQPAMSGEPSATVVR